MSALDKPLHVRVAEALGMEEIKLQGGPPGMMNYYQYNPDKQYIEGSCPRYDTDWAATGPLVEKYRIGVNGIGDHWWATWDGDKYQCPTCGYEKRNEITAGLWISDSDPDCPTPLIAICHLLLNLHAAGKL